MSAGTDGPLVDELVAIATAGAFRAVAMPPGQAHRLGPALARALSAALGDDR